MALTLADLLSVPQLYLRLLGSAEATLSSPILWAAVTELENPQPFLSGGELVLTTGVRQLTAAAQRAFVRQIKRAGAVGIGFGTGLGHDKVPQALIAEANRWAVPVVEVPYGTPFIAIGKLVADSRSADHYAKLERLLAQHQVLAQSLLSGGGLSALLDKLAAMIRTDVVLTQYTSTLFSSAQSSRPPSGGTGGGGAGSGVPGIAVDDEHWLPLVVATGKRDASTLWLRKPYDDGGIVDYAKSLISVELNNMLQRRQAARKLAGQVLQDVIRGSLDGADAAARLASVRINPAARNIVLLARVPAGQFQTLSSMALPPELEPAVAAALSTGDNNELLVIAAVQPADAGELGRALSRQMADVGITAPVGIGGAYAQANGLRWSYFEAKEAASRGLDVNEPERLSLTSLLLASGDVPMADMAAEALDPLLSFDAVHGAELINTLDSYLRLNGSVAAVAETLALHRNTVRYRLTQIAELTGYDPAVTADRVQLWLALAVRRLAKPGL